MSAALAPLQKQLASLEKAVNAEIADRKAAIGGLGSTVTGLQAGLTTQAADIITLQNALAAETSTRQADDTALGRRLDTLGSTLDLTSLTTRVATLETAVNKETTGLIAQTATLRTDLTAETSERKNSVSGLLNDLASVSTEVDTLKGDVSALTTAVGLGQQQSGLIADFNTLKSDLAIETAACETLKTTVDSLASLPVEVDTLKATVGSKQNGDTAATGLCLQIDALRADLTAETSALQALQNTVEDLDPTDSSARLGALEAAVGTRDPVNAPALFAQTASLRADLTAETTARTQADTALDAKIAAEAIARRYAFFDEAQRHTWRPSTNTVRLLSSITGATIEVGALKDVVVMVGALVCRTWHSVVWICIGTQAQQRCMRCLLMPHPCFCCGLLAHWGAKCRSPSM